MNVLDDDLRQLDGDPSDGGAWFRVGRDLRQGVADGILSQVSARLQALSPSTEYGRLAKGNALAIIKDRRGQGARRAAQRSAAARDAESRDKTAREKPAWGKTARRARAAERERRADREREQRPMRTHPQPDLPTGEAESAGERAARIRAVVADRRIKALLHFTRARQLSSISRHGLLPRKTLEYRGLAFEPNDNRRLDEAPNASCLSISWPNYRTFYRFRHDRFPNETWVVLELAPELLWELDCAFCYTNAAARCVRDLKLRERKTSSAFADLFLDHHGDPQRSECGIPDWCPTNPQAEVLVFDAIPAERIRSVYVEDVFDRRRIPSGNEIPVMISPRCFESRSDHRWWRNQHAAQGEEVG